MTRPFISIKRAAILLLMICSAAPHTTHAADYRLQTLEKAHDLFHSATNAAMYADAAEQYQYLVMEDGIRNGNLFYTLGNSWYMAGDIGRAILNYRRAEHYLPRSEDILHNLATALQQRKDFIPEKERPAMLEKLLGWHFNIPTSLRWWLFAAAWIGFWISWAWNNRSGRKESRIMCIMVGILAAIMLASLVTEAIQERREPGVVIAKEIIVRKGDGMMYAPAFLEPLHAGTEFQRLQTRGDWWQIRLADGQSCWIPAEAAETISI